MDFKIDDMAVYPAHGVGKITGIETLDFDGAETTFYVMEIIENGLVIRVPVKKAKDIGMRRVIEPSYIKKVYAILKDRDIPADNQTWNRRYREYMARIKTGDPLEVGKVLRDLALLRQSKTLSFGERKMFDQARSLLVQELAVARDEEDSVIEKEIDKIFSNEEESEDE